MLNRKTILQLYNGEIYPAEEIVPNDLKYRNNCKDVDFFYVKICSFLKEDDKHLLESFKNAIESRDSQERDITFCKGFSLSLKLTVGALADGS